MASVMDSKAVAILAEAVGDPKVRAKALAVAAGAAAVYYVWSRWQYSRKSKDYPPLVKQSMLQNIQMYSGGRIIWHLERLAKEYGSAFRLKMPQSGEWIVLNDAEDAISILEGDDSVGREGLDKPPYINRLNAMTGRPSIFTKFTAGVGPIFGWQWVRKAVAPAFSTKNIVGTTAILGAKVAELEQVLLEYDKDGKAFDVSQWSMRFTIEYLLEGMFGIDGGGMKYGQTEETFSDRLLRLFAIGCTEAFKKAMANPFRKYQFWSSDRRAALAAYREICVICQAAIDNYRATHTDEQTAKDMGIMGHVMRASYPSDKERVSDVFTFLLAGHDTTGYTVAWILVRLAQNQHILQKLQLELDGTNPWREDWKPDGVGKLKYLDAVIKESMRLDPVAALGPYRHSGKHSIKLKSGSIIPPNSTIVLPLFVFQRAGIEDPLDYKPERWQDPNSPDAERLKTMYMPFGRGKRDCVGRNLAMLEIKMVVASLVQRFNLKLAAEPEPTHFLTYKPTRAMIRATPRGATPKTGFFW